MDLALKGHNVCVTGRPCTGKSHVVRAIVQQLENRGHKVEEHWRHVKGATSPQTNTLVVHDVDTKCHTTVKKYMGQIILVASGNPPKCSANFECVQLTELM